MTAFPMLQTKNLVPGGILAIAAECRSRRARGERILDLSLGEPDFDTPEHIMEAAFRALEEGATRYTPAAGLAPLRQAVLRSLGTEGLRYAPREVMITCGATGAISCAVQGLLGDGDEVIIPAPFYPQYLNPIALTGAKAVIVETNAGNGFRMTAEMLLAAITPQTRMLILNVPSNPAGVIYTREELAPLAAIAQEHGLVILSDEVYAAFTYGQPFVSIAALAPESTLVIRSVSKTYAMTGWRIGYAAGPARLIEAMTTIQESSIVTPTAVSQWAALEALRAAQDCVGTIRDEFARRRALAVQKLSAIASVTIAAGEGGMFVFPDLSGRIEDVDAFCKKLLREQGVAIVPGREFGAPSCVRISLGTNITEIAEGLTKLAAAIEAESPVAIEVPVSMTTRAVEAIHAGVFAPVRGVAALLDAAMSYGAPTQAQGEAQWISA
jgi:aspartate aminotransferase